MFTYDEALLGLTTIVAWADGNNETPEVDARVQMIFEEKISDDSIESYKNKYKDLGTLEGIFDSSISSLKNEPIEKQANALAWMWKVANIASEGTDETYGHIDEVWKDKTANVDLKELQWINNAKKALSLPLEDFKKAFAILPTTKKI